MILLKATNETLEIATTSIANIDISVSYADITTTTFTPSTNEVKIITATTTTIVAAPAASTQRQIKLITICNIHASTSNTVTVDKDISGTNYNLCSATVLLAGETLQYIDGNGWTHYSSGGTVIQTGSAGGTSGQVQYNNAGALAGSPNFTWDNTNQLLNIGQATILPFNPIAVSGTTNNSVQMNIQNINSGTSASSDYVATSDTGTNTSNYVDMGINSSTYSDAGFTIGGPNDSYVYSNGGNLEFGTQTATKTIKFHTGGTLAANLRATISDTGLDLVNGLSATNVPNGITTANTAIQSQTVVAGTYYYITGSGLAMPATPKMGMSTSTTMQWQFIMQKSAAGTAANSICIYRGTNGSIADTRDVTQSIGTATAAVDTMTVLVTLKVTATGATGSYTWGIACQHKAATGAGFGVLDATPFFTGTVSGVAMNTASLIFGLGFYNQTGTPTIQVAGLTGIANNMS
jgi:hypothetical protein